MGRLWFLLVWLGVLVVALAGVALYLAGGMYVGILLVLVAAAGATGLVTLPRSRTSQSK